MGPTGCISFKVSPITTEIIRSSSLFGSSNLEAKKNNLFVTGRQWPTPKLMQINNLQVKIIMQLSYWSNT